MTTALAMPAPVMDPAIIERVLIHGDLKQLSAAQKISYYKSVCESLGLNPLTQPFAYIVLNGKEVLYAKRDAAEQLRKVHAISITISARELIADCYVVTARASMPSGRQDESTGVVAIGTLKGENLANAYMKAETKAKRRVTLSVCGLGMLDETEVESIPSVTYSVEAPAPAPQLIPAVGRERETASDPIAGGQSGSFTRPTKASLEAAVKQAVEKNAEGCFQAVDDMVGLAGKLWIQKFSAGGSGSLKGKIVLSTGEELAIFNEQLAKLAEQCCQRRDYILLHPDDVKTSKTSGRPYLVALHRETPETPVSQGTPLDEATFDAYVEGDSTPF